MNNMSESSHSARSKRRIPQQERAAERIALLLDAAGEVIAAKGYAATTLTEVAALAGTSIGSLYQYYPDKTAVVAALGERYGREIDLVWRGLVDDVRGLPLRRCIDLMLSAVLAYVRRRPAFAVLLAGADGYRHDAEMRTRLRDHVATILLPHARDISSEELRRVTGIVVQIIKAFCSAAGGVKPADQNALHDEYRWLLDAYLAERLIASGERATP